MKKHFLAHQITEMRQKKYKKIYWKQFEYTDLGQ